MSLGDFRIDIYSPAGVLQGQLTGGLGQSSSASLSGFQYLTYTKRVNDVGQCRFRVPADHSIVSLMSDKSIVEVYRRNVDLGIDWTLEFSGLYRDAIFERRDTATFDAVCYSNEHILSWRTVDYVAGTANRNEFASAKGETVLKNIVTYNLTSSGTTGDGRKRNATNAGTVNYSTITIQADAATGNTISVGVFGLSALEACRKVARIAGGDFALVRTSAATYQFRWYLGQLGTDRSTGSAKVEFNPDRGNMAESRYQVIRSSEYTQVNVWGAGDGSLRDWVSRTGTNYALATNDIEGYVDARELSLGNTTGLNAKGDVALDQARSRTMMTFRPLQTASTAYGLHYVLGDKVTSYDYGVSTTHRIQAVTVTASPDTGEDISLELLTI